MTGIQECFSDYREKMNFQMTMGNKAKCTPIGRGAIVFQREIGEQFCATNVLHVPGLGMNLLFVSQLQGKSYDIFFIKEKVGCALGKYAKATFPRSKNRANNVLGLIHSDICGPMSTKALSGVEYFLTFIDDHSRKTWIYFLKTKDEVFCRFKEFKAPVENLTGKKIKVLRSDNGGEYVDNDFADFCAKDGIKREWTTLYNLE
eukprot:PITA_02283